MLFGDAVSELIWSIRGDAPFLTGVPKLEWLNTSKNCVPISRLPLSQHPICVIFCTVRSSMKWRCLQENNSSARRLIL